MAARVKAALDAHGLAGVYVPMMLVRPPADVPLVQVSVLASEDPDAHLHMGAALAALRADNIAVVGSGFASLHNLPAMAALRRPADRADRAAFKAASDAWAAALAAAVEDPDPAARRRGLAAWRALPHADRMHPPAAREHFMPLLVCAGAALDAEPARSYKDDFLGIDIYTWYWGADSVD